MAISVGKYLGYKRLSDENGFFKMVATDQRPPIMNIIKQKLQTENVSYKDVAEIKKILIKKLSKESSAVLVDPIWGYPQSYEYIDYHKGLIITLEEHDFYENERGRRSSIIKDWSVAKIKSMGADAVKVLAWYRPDGDEETCLFQQEYVEKIGKECKKYDIPFLFELLVYPLKGEENQTQDYVEHASKHPENVINSLKEFADPKYGVDIFKLESPIPASIMAKFNTKDSEQVQYWFNQIEKISSVPWVMLSAGATMEQFYNVMQYAYKAGASGYLAGRAIWWQATVEHFPDLKNLENELDASAQKYMKKLNELTYKQANPWFKHHSFVQGVEIDGCDNNFPSNYNPQI